MNKKIKIISWNVNGLRAVERKNILQPFIDREKPDIFFMQEIKCKQEQLSEYLTRSEDYFQHYHSAEKPGYAGTGLWILKKSFPGNIAILTGMPGWNDYEGRVLGFQYEEYIFMGIYFPNGGKSREAWDEKLRFYDHFLNYVNALKAAGKKLIWAGDLNVAHNEIDLARPKENKKNIGFLPEERAWFDRVVASGWVDIFRYLYKDKVSYTYWDMPSRARERNVGWRVDYFLVDSFFTGNTITANHLNDDQGSDHCPVELTTNI